MSSTPRLGSFNADVLALLASKGTVPGLLGSLMLAFPPGVTVAAGTYVLTYEADFAFTILSANVSAVSGGTIGSLAVQIAASSGTQTWGTPVSVTGLSALSAGSTASKTTAIGANAVAVGQQVTLVISGVSGSPTGLAVNLHYQRT